MTKRHDYFLLLFAPLDQVFIGPFSTRARAKEWAEHYAHEGHDVDVLTHAQMLDNQRKYGEIPVQEPTQ